jgi:hypothetical protein
MFKSLVNSARGLALLGLAVVMMGAILIAPGSAAAASCRPGGTGPQACVAVQVHVYDRQSGAALGDAKVTLRDVYGNVTYAYLMNERGVYLAYEVHGEYKVTAVAPAHFAYATEAMVQPQLTVVNAPLASNVIDRSGSVPSRSTGAPAASTANY